MRTPVLGRGSAFVFERGTGQIRPGGGLLARGQGWSRLSKLFWNQRTTRSLVIYRFESIFAVDSPPQRLGRTADANRLDYVLDILSTAWYT